MADQMHGEVTFSIVVPIFNEEENVRALYARTAKVLEPLGSFEMIFVDDGSTDRSLEEVRRLQHDEPRVKLIKLSRNFGHQAAITAGLDYSRGAAVIVLDGDLQDPPELIGEFVTLWRHGYEVVFGVRRQRPEGLLKRASYFAFYRLFEAISTIKMPVDAGDFSLMDRRVVDVIIRLPERNKFLRGLRSWAGFRQVGVEYDRPVRFKGKPKYTLMGLLNLALNGIVTFSVTPLRIASILGVLFSCLGGVYLCYALASKLLYSTPPGWASLVALIVLMGGINLLLLGLQGEYLGRIFEELKGRPPYIVEALYDPDRSSPAPPRRKPESLRRS